MHKAFTLMESEATYLRYPAGIGQGGDGNASKDKVGGVKVTLMRITFCKAVRIIIIFRYGLGVGKESYIWIIYFFSISA